MSRPVDPKNYVKYEVYLSRDLGEILPCSRCGQHLPSSDFPFHSTAPARSYARRNCKPCAVDIAMQRNRRLRKLDCGVVACTNKGNSEIRGTLLCSGHEARVTRHGDAFAEIPLNHRVPDAWEQRRSTVYVAYNVHQAPIYVGSAFGDGERRHTWHKLHQPWAAEISYFRIISEHPTRGDAYDAEKVAIRELSKSFRLYNVTWNNQEES